VSVEQETAQIFNSLIRHLIFKTEIKACISDNVGKIKTAKVSSLTLSKLDS